MKKIATDKILSLLLNEDVSDLTLASLEALVRRDGDIRRSLPDGRYEVDPRNGDVVLFVSSRENRPQDTHLTQGLESSPGDACPICQGKTTGIIDMASLSRGFTFINKNLFPVFYPYNAQELENMSRPSHLAQQPTRQTVRGMHFLQWTTSYHDVFWHNLPLEDGVVVIERLAALEKTLLGLDQDGRERYVVISKNFGRLVGSSLAHDHQQIALTSVMPRRFADNQRFRDWHGETFSSYMLRVNPPELTVRDYGPAVLIVPYFMRRPLDMMLLLKDDSKPYLHTLDQGQITAVAAAWRDAIRAIMQLMPQNGREIAFNVITNNGPGAGLYFEFLPYTQESGGFEHLGLITCEGDPGRVAERLRAVNN